MMSVLGRIITIVKQIFLFIAHGFKKITCINKRKKVLREDDPTSVVVIPLNAPPTSTQNFNAPSEPLFYPSSNSGPLQDVQMQEWDNWDNDSFDVSTKQAPTTVYSSVLPETNENPEPNVDFFKDMEPTVKVKKVLVRKKTNESVVSNRLAMDQDLDFKVSGELEEWRDEDGWSGEDEGGLEIDEAKILREAHEQRKLERQERAKQQRYQKSLKAHDKLGLKVS